MATTTRSNLIVPEIMQEAVQGEFEGMTALYGTSAAVVNGSLPQTNPNTGQRIRGGDTVTVPYFDTLGELEEVAEGDGLTPAQLTMSDETATVKHAGKMFELTYWANLAANFADPYAEAARQLRVAANRYADQQLLNVAASSPLVFDLSAETDPTISYDAVIDTATLWGDEQEEIVLMVVHSHIYADLLKLKGDGGRPLVQAPTEGQLPRFAGIPVKVSDRVSVNADVYDVQIHKRGGSALWFQGAPRFLSDQDISADSELGAIHVYLAPHRYKRRPGETKTGVALLRCKRK